MKTHIEQLPNKCRLHINGLHTEWFSTVDDIYNNIHNGLDLFHSQSLRNSNSELSKKCGKLRLSQTTGTYNIYLT